MTNEPLGPTYTQAEMDVIDERAHQREKYGDAHDDQDRTPECLVEGAMALCDMKHKWPFPEGKLPGQVMADHGRREQLVRAAAMILAAIDQMDRQNGKQD